MTQGRKSKTARVLGCLLVAALALAAISPALAPAQSGAEDEYELGNLPGSGGSQSSGGDSSSSPAGVAPSDTATGETATGETGTTAGGGDSKGGHKGGSGNGAGSTGSNPAPASGQDVPSLTTNSSDEGCAPVLLILLAAAAALCTGVAVWRLRRDPGGPGGPTQREPATGTKPTTSAASETQSL